jgi:F-type H+-transporting ATPase subunit a
MGISDLEVSLAPKTVFEIMPGFPVTNTMITMWVVMAILIGLALGFRLSMKYLPKGYQSLVEWALGGLYNFMEQVGGKDSKKHFPIFITFFLTILFSNWLGIAMGLVAEESGVLRAATSDLNSTIAFALVAFAYFEYQGFKAHGFFGYVGHFINVKALIKNGPMGFIDFFVGLLHIVSELVRPTALALRLFGNIFGGEIVLTVAFLLFSPLLPLPFMMLEVIIGLIQAFVFSMLFLTFTALNSAHEDSHEEEHKEHGQSPTEAQVKEAFAH